MTRRAISAPLLTCVLGLPDSLQNRGSFQRQGDTPWMRGGVRLLCRTPAILFYFFPLEDDRISAIWIEAGLPRQKKIVICQAYREWKYLGQED